ncbi:class I SAM-dependent methyltransferase, partial [Kitasatospora sp. NPDC001175]|uniref:class I SAM-dependent methyltransferase n=1 Tax=Kitasatospora sp. NPDC001175 TaxID=3157103 RepID=UPI003D08C4FC
MTGDPHMQPLRTDRGPLYLRQADGQRPRLTLHRLDTEPSTADETLLKRCTGPVLDIGCGPGRLTQALTRRGVVTLGIDIAPCAVARTLAVGAAALRRSVFDPLPNEGDWQTLVLADGNIGIGGDPQALLRRCAQLAAPDGVLLTAALPHIRYRLRTGLGARPEPAGRGEHVPQSGGDVLTKASRMPIPGRPTAARARIGGDFARMRRIDAGIVRIVRAAGFPVAADPVRRAGHQSTTSTSPSPRGTSRRPP